jgi:hypothetical protein
VAIVYREPHQPPQKNRLSRPAYLTFSTILVLLEKNLRSGADWEIVRRSAHESRSVEFLSQSTEAAAMSFAVYDPVTKQPYRAALSIKTQAFMELEQNLVDF